MVLDEAFKLSARDEVLQPDIRKTGIHPNFWYPVARSDNVKTGKPHGVSFTGEPIHDAVEDFVAQGLATVAAGRLKCRGRALQNEGDREENHQTNRRGDYRLASWTRS